MKEQGKPMSSKLLLEAGRLKDLTSKAAYHMIENRYRLSPKQVKQMLQAAKEAQQVLEKIQKIAYGNFVEDSLDIVNV